MSTPAPISAPAGWYPDPSSQGGLRYYDGAAWTQHLAASPLGAPPWASAPTGVGSDPSDPVHWLIPTGRTWQSIAAGYVALLATFLWFLGPVALGLGIWAITVSKRSGAHGRGRAIFAIIVGSVTTVAMIGLLASLG